MQASLTLIQYAGGAAFVLLGATNLWIALRRGDRRRRYFSASLLILGLLSLIDRVAAAGAYRWWALSIVTTVMFALSGYSLLLFRDSFLRVSLRTKRLAAAVVALGATLTIVTRVPSGPHPTYSGPQALAMVAIIGPWALFSLEPMVRFWLASRSRPAIQRARLRALAAGYAVVVVLVLVMILVTPGDRSPLTSLVANALGIAVAPVLYASFSPPWFIRRAWRWREQRALRAGTEHLLAHAADAAQLAGRALPWAVRLVGGEAGLIVEAGGTVLGALGMSGERAARLAARLGPLEGPMVAPIGPRADVHVIAVPMATSAGTSLLAVVSGPFTPLFGSEEVQTLVQYGASVAVALDRVHLTEELEGQTTLYETLLRAESDLGQGVLLTEAGRLVYANEAYVALTGYTVAELAAMPTLVELTVAGEREAIRERLRTRLTHGSGPERYESALVRKDGATVEVEVAVKLLPGKGGGRMVSLVRDISERKRIESALVMAYDRERQAAEQLRRTDELKNDFLSAVSHELRTPLTSVLGFALTLEQQDGGLTAEDRSLYLSRLAFNARKLERLLSDLLDVGRLTRGVLLPDLGEVELGATVTRVVREAPVGDHPVAVEAERVTALVDRPKVERIVENLLSNAAKYSPSGSPIRISVREHGADVLIVVEDEGPGVPEGMREAIFQPFERGSARRPHAPGTGIGLTLVARFAELHGGRAWVSDRPGGGAAFCVLLPRGLRAQPRRVALPVGAPAAD